MYIGEREEESGNDSTLRGIRAAPIRAFNHG